MSVHRARMATSALFPPAPPGMAVYDYGVLLPGGSGTLQCPCGRTDKAERAEKVLTEHLYRAPVGSQAVIFVRHMAADGTTGPAQLYALAERGEHSVIWPATPEDPMSVTTSGLERPAVGRREPGSPIAGCS